MLILTRKTNEEIVIDGRIVVRLVEARNGAARIGITAPKDMSVHRKEVQDKLEPVPTCEHVCECGCERTCIHAPGHTGPHQYRRT